MMSFIDTLDQSALAEEQYQEIAHIKETAFHNFISDLEIAIKHETTNAAKQGKHVISGFFTSFHGGYGGNPSLGFVDWWDDTKECTHMLENKYRRGCPSIFRVDRIESSYFEKRYGGLFGNPFIRNSHIKFIILSNKEIEELCQKIETLIKELGFTEYKVTLINKKFYLLEETTKHGVFGIKKNLTKHNDGIGKTLHIELKW